MSNETSQLHLLAFMLNAQKAGIHIQHKYIWSLVSVHNQTHEQRASHSRLMDPCWAAEMKEDRGINFDDLWKLLVMTFMNILWKVENVIINFYIRKWGRNIKQTALNIERGPPCQKKCAWNNGDVNRTEVGETKRGTTTRCSGWFGFVAETERSSECAHQPRETRPRWTAVWAFSGSSRVKSHHHLFIYWSGLSPPLVLFLLMYCAQNKSQQNVSCSLYLVLTLPCICSNLMCRQGERGARQLSASNTQDTFNHMETINTGSTTSDGTTLATRDTSLCALELQQVLQTLPVWRKSALS